MDSRLKPPPESSMLSAGPRVGQEKTREGERQFGDGDVVFGVVSYVLESIYVVAL